MITIGQRASAILTLLTGCSLLGCGLVIPDIKEVWDADKPADSQTPRIPGTAQIEFEVKKHVFCELEKAVKYVNSFPVSSGPSPSKSSPLAKYPIPLDWFAQVSLSFQVDESSSLTPGVTFNTILPNDVRVFGPGTSGTVTTPQSRMLGFGSTLSSTATRIDKFNPAYSVRYLMIPNGPKSVCLEENDPFLKVGWKPNASSPFILQGNLGIQDWLFGAILTDIFISSQTGPAGGGAGGGQPKTDTVSYEVKFIIVSNGSVTPIWKLVNISANTTGTLFGAGRTRTHDLIITIGPNDTRTLYAHLASEIGQAVSGGNQSLLGH
jgi:hypothetical protein